MKDADDKEVDVMITGFGHTAPGNPVALSKHSAKVLPWEKANEAHICQVMLTSMPKTFILVF